MPGLGFNSSISLVEELWLKNGLNEEVQDWLFVFVFFFETGSQVAQVGSQICNVAQDDLDFRILLPLPSVLGLQVCATTLSLGLTNPVAMYDTIYAGSIVVITEC